MHEASAHLEHRFMRHPHMKGLPTRWSFGTSIPCMMQGDTLVMSTHLVNLASLPLLWWARVGTEDHLSGLPTWPSPKEALSLSLWCAASPCQGYKASGHRCGHCQPPGPMSGNSAEEDRMSSHNAIIFSQNMPHSQINVSPTLSHHNIHMAHYWF